MKNSFTPQGEKKVGIILLAGFLGSGKTTLLKKILSWETDLSDTVVLVNEFGDIGIDGALLKNSGSDVVELTSGCICCTLAADLKQSIQNIWKRFKPRRLFIEATGVADPASVVSVLKEPKIHEIMTLKKIITVLDADYWEAREVFGPLFFSQLETADLILLNKVDLIDKTKIPQFLDEIHQVIPDSQVIPTFHCGVDPETLWKVTHHEDLGIKPIHFFHNSSADHGLHEKDQQNHDHESTVIHDHSTESTDATNYVAFSFQGSEPMDENCFKRFIKDLPWELFRMKGSVRFKDRTVLLNFVGGKSNWGSWDGPPETRLAFIGWESNSDKIIQKLENCIIRS